MRSYNDLCSTSLAKDEHTSTSDPLTGLQGEGVAGGSQRGVPRWLLAKRHDLHPNQIFQWNWGLIKANSDPFLGWYADILGYKSLVEVIKCQTSKILPQRVNILIYHITVMICKLCIIKT